MTSRNTRARIGAGVAIPLLLAYLVVGATTTAATATTVDPTTPSDLTIASPAPVPEPFNSSSVVEGAGTDLPPDVDPSPSVDAKVVETQETPASAAAADPTAAAAAEPPVSAPTTAPASPATDVAPTPVTTPAYPASDTAPALPPMAATSVLTIAPLGGTCTASEVNRTNASLIDSYDMRTWPQYVTPSQGMPGYKPHTGATNEGRDIWEQVTTDDPRWIDSGAGGVYWDKLNPTCYPEPLSVTYTATAENLSASGDVLAVVTSTDSEFDATPANSPGTIGQSVLSRATFDITFPPLQTILDRNGNPTTDFYQGVNTFRIAGTPVNSHHGGNWEWPTNVAVACSPTERTYGMGAHITVTCATTATLPDVSFDEYQQAAFEHSGIGIISPLTTELTLEARYVDAVDPTMSGDWRPYSFVQPGFSGYEIKLATAWLPAAQEQHYRVKAAETLTVTPEGLLTGAEWSEGDIGSLDTYITSVPEGGTVTPDGNLEFTSQQIGNYGFSYYLADPVSGLRSQEAPGTIEVYDEVVPNTPTATAAPPVVADPVTPSSSTTSSLASTGANPLPVIVSVGLLLTAGMIITFFARRRRTH